MDPSLLWFFIGVAFLLLEFIVPGVILIFFTFSAWVVSLLCLTGLFEDNLNMQLIIFTVIGVLSLFILRKYVKSWFNGKESHLATTNFDEQDWLNKKVQVTQDIPANGYGRVEYNGTSWKATAKQDISKDTLVIIKSQDDLCFTVEA